MSTHLFYQSRLPRPELDRAEGIYMWDTTGKRYIDGSSGAMVSNIGHSNPNVLAAMQKQMERGTFGYRLHFQTKASEKLAARAAAQMLEGKILEEGPQTCLAFMVEPVGGASTGALVPPAGYMQRIREICDQYGVLLIHDEVMSGGGRTGRFFAAEHWDVTPDIICLSKGFGGGYVPLGAVIARDDIVEAVLDNGGFIHGHTYAGNPLACAAGLAVIDEIERENLTENSALMGDKLAENLRSLMQKYSIIGDVRGKGLLAAFELMSDRATKAPLPKGLNAYNRLVDIAYEKGLIIYSRRTRGGLAGDHFLVCPPMITTEAQLGEITDLLDASLAAFTVEISQSAA